MKQGLLMISRFCHFVTGNQPFHTIPVYNKSIHIVHGHYTVTNQLIDKPLVMVELFFSPSMWKRRQCPFTLVWKKMRKILNRLQNKRCFILGYRTIGICKILSTKLLFPWKIGKVSLNPTGHSAWYQHDKTITRTGPVEISHQQACGLHRLCSWTNIFRAGEPEWRQMNVHASHSCAG